MSKSTIVILLVIAIVVIAYLFLIHNETKKNITDVGAPMGPTIPDWWKTMMDTNAGQNQY